MQSPVTKELRVRFTKRRDGTVILHCIRKDDSETWQRHDKHAVFFSFHDLTHFAVETTLGLRHGFYGLLADGWDITDTSGKGTRGKLSFESVLVEHIVGLFDRERAGGTAPMTAAEFNPLIEQMTGRSLKHPFSDVQLNAARNRIEDLHRQWIAVPPGSSLDLLFDRSDPAFVMAANSLKAGIR